MIEDHYARFIARDAKMRDPNTADNLDVRKSILVRVKSGEITLAQGQSELEEIKRQARRDGKPLAYEPQGASARRHNDKLTR